MVSGLGGWIGAVALAAGPAAAQDAHGDLRKRLLGVADASYEQLARDPEIVDAATGQSGHTTFRTSPGTMYFVYGLCDENCANIDIEVSETDEPPFSESDRRPDARPIIATPIFDTAREVRIDVDMVACRTQTCAMGIAIYAVEIR